MFDLFSWSHIVILLAVALVVVGPKDLPRLMNMAGKWAGKARAMANEFRKSFDEMARQAELDELRKEIEDLKKNNPVADIAAAAGEIHNAVNHPVEAMMAGTAAETPLPEPGPEPRMGEFQVTEPTPAGEPAATPASEPTPP